MAKGIRERLLEQAIKFHQWQEATYPGKTSEELGGEWEVDYPYWNDTYSAFCHVLTQMDAETADSVLLDEMVYLIARDNEAEGFIQETTSHPQWFSHSNFMAMSSFWIIFSKCYRPNQFFDLCFCNLFKVNFKFKFLVFLNWSNRNI